MTLFIDNKVNFEEDGVISNILEWHRTESLLAIASYSQSKGGIIYIVDEYGNLFEESGEFSQIGQQASALSWHPQKSLLIVGWENGNLHLWKNGNGWQLLQAPHTAPPLLLAWSAGGGRLIVSDAANSFTGWRSTTSGLLMAYHLTVDEPLTHVAFCPLDSGISEGIVRGLAKAAIAGDEGALDVLASWRPRTAPRVTGVPIDNHSLFAAQQNGNILFIDDSGTCLEILTSIGIVQYMEMTSKNTLIIAWESGTTLSLTCFLVNINRKTLESKMHVKMTNRVGLSICSAGGSSVAILSGETVIRIWDSETNDNFVLPFEERSPSHNPEIFTGMAYSPSNYALCCGSNQGKIYIWRKDHHGTWNLINTSSVKGNVKQICWGSENGIRPLLAVNSVTNVMILREQPICWGYTNYAWGIQKGPNNIYLEGSKGTINNVTTDICIKAMCINETYLAVTDGKNVQIFKIAKDTFNFLPIHKFPWSTETLLIHDETLVGIVGSHIEAKTTSGISLGPLPSSDSEGEPIGISKTDCYLAIATMDGSIKIVEISKKGFRSHYNSRNCYQLFDDFGEIMYASVNSAGRLVCLAIATSNLVPEPILYVWDAANDSLKYINLKGDEGETCIPITICWDSSDPRLVACHIRSTKADMIKCFFVNNEGISEYRNWQNLKDNQNGENLCAVSAPYVITINDGKLVRNIMFEFIGSEDCDSVVRNHLLDYLYHMTLGNMEQAVVSISHTKAGGAVWEALARACVFQKRLDVASICLAKMNNVKGALALHYAMENPKLGVKSRTAILAIHLGMLNEAKKLFEEDERYDLLSRMTAATRDGLEKLIKTPMEGEASLLVKNAHFKLGCLKRESNELEEATACFQKAGVEVPHVPRMYLQAGQMDLLKQKVESSSNPELHLWWAHYQESQGELEGALESYANAKDSGSQARLLCHMDRLQDAQALAENPAAAYYIARHLELQPEQADESIKHYMKAGAAAAAVRCGIEAQLWDQVAKAGTATAIIGGNSHTLLAASALEKIGRPSAAASLYHQAGKFHKAVEVALSAEMDNGVEALARVANSIIASGSGSCSPSLARRLVDPLVSTNQPHHAAIVLATAKLFDEALNLIEEHNIEISEELAERLTPEKDAENRVEVLQKLSDLLGQHGHYHLAAKKLTQAGDKVAAMRWLVKSGDIDKMIFFASVSRDRSVYLMAARALQAADWRARPDLLRSVATFYTKARAPRPLAAFYAACAQQEIDDYQNYEKALGAYSEALRCLSRSNDPLAASDASILQSQADQVQKYLNIEKYFNDGDYQKGIKNSQNLLSEIDEKGPVRSYHILQLMATKSIVAGYTSNAKEYSEQARILEKRAESLEVQRRGNETPPSDQEVPEDLITD